MAAFSEHQFEFRGLHDWQVRRFGPAEYSTDINARLTIYVRAIGPVADQTAHFSKVAPLINCRNVMLRRERDELFPMTGKERVGAHNAPGCST